MSFRFLAFLGLAACGGGGSFCERSAEGSCDEVSDEEIAACEEGLADCSNDDLKILDDVIDCLDREGLLECTDGETATTGGTEDFAAFLACYAPALGLSPECQAAMSTGSGTYSTPSTM